MFITTIGPMMLWPKENNNGNCIDKEMINFAFKTLTGQNGTLKLTDCTSLIFGGHPHVG